jgi:hypothetical protein
MLTEWMKVMLEEIARKKAEAEQERIERLRRERHDDAARPDEDRREE